MWKPLLCAAAFVLVSADADAKRLKPSSVSASSTYPMEDGQSYDAKLVHDGKLATSWVEGDSGGGLGAWVQLNFDQPVTVKRIRVWGGMWYSYDFWNRANRPKQLEIRYSTGEVESFDLPNDMLMQEFTLAKAKDTELNSPNGNSEVKYSKRNIPNESFHAKDPKPKSPSERYKAKDCRTKMPIDILKNVVRVALV